MITTNVYNIPGPIVSAIRNDKYKKVGDISVTGLLRPPQMRVIEKAHDTEITEDVSDGIWRLLGQSVHSVLERADTTHHLSEERLTTEVDGWVVSGQPDLLDQDGTLSDYKVTSVFSFLLGDKPEWEAQLNIYAWLYGKYGFVIKRLQIVAILRDWTSSKVGEDYPPAAVQVVNVPLWETSKTTEFVAERVRLHKAADRGEIIGCTAQERWERPTTWAVMKVGGKRAKRVFNNNTDAAKFCEESGKGHEVVERKGQQVRCARFCNAAKWCPQAKTLGVMFSEEAE